VDTSFGVATKSDNQIELKKDTGKVNEENLKVQLDTLTSAREIKARGVKIIEISDVESNVYDYRIEIPKTDE